jgi:HAD superfamily hydrolase (TIGR01450 family)
VTGTAALVDRYDLVIFDLDGVVYLGLEPVPGAVETIGRLHERRQRIAFATNNAMRRPDEVADLLTSMGVTASADEVLTSPQAAAGLLAERLPAGSAVLVVGTDALRTEVSRVGLIPVDMAGDGPAAVVQGYGPHVGWPELAEACVAIRAGALWIATNADRTLPSPRGPLPGNGALVAALATALDRQPDAVVGKPAPTLFARAAKRSGAGRPLVVGDRLDTDIEGATRAGMDSLLVLTGVSTPQDLLSAPPQRRPSFVAESLAELFEPPGGVGRWRVRHDGGGLELSGSGTPVEALRALCAAVRDGAPPGEVAAGSPEAQSALRALRLAG